MGVVVRSLGIGGNVKAGLGSVLGGEKREYAQTFEENRYVTLDRLVPSAKAAGANALLMMRFVSTEIAQIPGEMVACGTAAVIELAPRRSSCRGQSYP